MRTTHFLFSPSLQACSCACNCVYILQTTTTNATVTLSTAMDHLHFFILALLPLSVFISTASAQLRQNYYSNICPNVESIVRAAVTQKFQQTFVTAPATLRLFFHDCFVRVSPISFNLWHCILFLAKNVITNKPFMLYRGVTHQYCLHHLLEMQRRITLMIFLLQEMDSIQLSKLKRLSTGIQVARIRSLALTY